MRNKKTKKVLVAMSGGVDSSVSAALLKEQGYDVSGVFMIFQKSELLACHYEENPGACSNCHSEAKPKNPRERSFAPHRMVQGFVGLRPPQDDTKSQVAAMTTKDENKCCSQEAMERARQVATKLGISFYVMDFSAEFQRRVINYFIREYKNGRTPNPCVVCNKFIKLGLLLDKALAMGFDYVATGHYVKLTANGSQLTANKKPSAVSCRPYMLYAAKDKTRDQSYFLYNLTQDKLARLFFPLGNYLKSQVWQMAKDRGLSIPKTESRGICFIKDNNIADFLAQVIKFKNDLIKDIKTEKVLGEHHGLQLYTIGQRQAIGIGGTGPYYVVKLDLARNTLWVTNNPKDRALFSDSLTVTNVHWIFGQKPRLPLKCQARIRYGHKTASCVVGICHCEETKICDNCHPEHSEGSRKRIFCTGCKRSDPRTQNKRSFVGLRPPQDDDSGLYCVTFSKPQRAITPGQSIVFYGLRHEMLGGGVIK